MLTICGQQEIQLPVQTESQDGELPPGCLNGFLTPLCLLPCMFSFHVCSSAFLSALSLNEARSHAGFSFKDILDNRHLFSCNPAAGVIQNVRLSLMIFLADGRPFARVNPQIWLDNILNNSGWSHSPDLAAAAIWRGEEESASAYQLHLLKEEEFTPSVAPVDFEPFVFCRPWIASQGLRKSEPSNASSCWGGGTLSCQQDVTDSADLHATTLSRLCGSAALIAFVIEDGLNQALCST